MRAHQTVGVTKPVVAFIDVLKDSQKRRAILVILEDVLFFVSPAGDMINSAGVFDAQWAGHEVSLAED